MAREQRWNPLLKSYPFSEKVNSVSIGAEVLFCRLIAQADDYGNYWSEPRMILATLFPHRWAKKEVSETDVARWRNELVTPPARSRYDDVPLAGRKRNEDEPEACGPLVATYSVGGVEYLHIISPRRRFRSDRIPDERFPREPETIEEDARSASVTLPCRQRTASVPLDPDPDPDIDPEETKKKTIVELKNETPLQLLPTPNRQEPADEVIDHLNASMNPPGRFQHSEESRKHIRARLNEKATVDDCKMVIDVKAAQWGGDPAWEDKLRPKTLFTPEHFESYMNEAVRWIEKGRPKLRKEDWKGEAMALANRMINGEEEDHDGN